MWQLACLIFIQKFIFCMKGFIMHYIFNVQNKSVRLTEASVRSGWS